MLAHRWSVRAVLLGTVLCVALGVAACMAPPAPAPIAAAANPHVPVPVGQYRSVTAGAESFRQVEAKSWRDKLQ